MQEHQRPTPYLTEIGLYKYLLQSNKPEAEEFQDYVYNLLVKQRRAEFAQLNTKYKIMKNKNEWDENTPEQFDKFVKFLCEDYKQANDIDPTTLPKYEHVKNKILTYYYNKNYKLAHKRFNELLSIYDL
jgi:prophage antirepressor-like protein